MPKVSIPTPLRSLSDGKDHVDVDGATVGAVLQALVALHPGLADRVFDENRNLRRFLNIYLNDEDIRYLDDLDTAVTAADRVDIIPNVAGGALP